MALFEKELTPEVQAAERIVMMRERGTRRLLLLTVCVIAAWFANGKIQDYFLLRQQWTPLSYDAKGLTVIGALDSRGDYDRNLFKIIQGNKTTRVELTDFGWSALFPEDGEGIFSPDIAERILGIVSVDGATGYAILTPYLKAGIARFQKQPNAEAAVSEDMLIEVPESKAKPQTLGALLKKYADAEKEKANKDETEGGGTGSSKNVEHGTPLPGEVLVRSCPVALTGAMFEGAEVIEQPASVLSDKMYTVHFDLTKEGRSRFYRWSRNHSNESLVFIVNGRVLTAGRVTQPLDVNWWEINNIRDEDAAKALAASVSGNAKR